MTGLEEERWASLRCVSSTISSAVGPVEAGVSGSCSLAEVLAGSRCSFSFFVTAFAFFSPAFSLRDFFSPSIGYLSSTVRSNSLFLAIFASRDISYADFLGWVISLPTLMSLLASSSLSLSSFPSSLFFLTAPSSPSLSGVLLDLVTKPCARRTSGAGTWTSA